MDKESRKRFGCCPREKLAPFLSDGVPKYKLKKSSQVNWVQYVRPLQPLLELQQTIEPQGEIIRPFYLSRRSKNAGTCENVNESVESKMGWGLWK